MYSFVNGVLYRHATGDINSFYGSERKTSEIEFISNNHPQLRKTYEVFNIDTNGDWTTLLEIEPDDNYPYGQKTTIFPQRFKSHDGVKTAAIPMNIIFPDGTESLQRLYSGNKMSGNAIKIKLSSTNFDILRKAKVYSINK